MRYCRCVVSAVQRPTYHHTAMCMLGHPEHSFTCYHAPSGAYECRPPTSRARSTPWICRYPSSATAVTLAQLWIAVSRPPGDPVLRRGRTPDRADPSCLRSRRPSPSLACRPKLVAKPVKPFACLPAEARCKAGQTPRLLAGRSSLQSRSNPSLACRPKLVARRTTSESDRSATRQAAWRSDPYALLASPVAALFA